MLKNKVLFIPLLIGVLMISVVCHFLMIFAMSKSISIYEIKVGLTAPSALDFWIGVVVAGLFALVRRVTIKMSIPVFQKIMKAKYVGID